MTDRLTLRRPDDWHVHLRDGPMLEAVARHTARQFARAIVMPNLTPPVTSVAAASAYRDRIRAAVPDGFTPLMTCYLTDDADPDEIARGFAEGVFTAAKLYPAPTAPRTQSPPRRPPAAAPASSTRPMRWKATPRCLRRRARSIGWKPSHRRTAPASTACP